MDGSKENSPQHTPEHEETVRAEPGASEQDSRSSEESTERIAMEEKLSRFRPIDEAVCSYPLRKSLNVMVIGERSSGKSSTANTLLGGEKYFQEGTSTMSVTVKFQSTIRKTENGCELTVVDTPGSYNTKMSKDIKIRTIDCYLIVINLTNPYFNKAKLKDLEALKGIDGKLIIKAGNCLAVLSHGDGCLQDKSLQEYLNEIKGGPLYTLLTESLQKNMVAIDNMPALKVERDRHHQVLLQKVNDTVVKSSVTRKISTSKEEGPDVAGDTTVGIFRKIPM